MENANLTNAERKIYIAKSLKVSWKSRFQFLQSHRGFRDGCIHLFLGTAGGGKSTLVRTLLIDILDHDKQNRNVLLQLSEETTADFNTELCFSQYENSNLENLKLISELGGKLLEINHVDKFLEYMEFVITNQEIKLWVIDNITTSKLYADKTPQDQAATAIKIKTLASKLNIPVIIFAHTGAQVSDNMGRLIEDNDIRGSKTIINLTQFLYIMQRFVLKDVIFPTIKISKHRGQMVDNKIYRLDFNKKVRIILTDHLLPFEEFKEAFKGRNTL